MTKSELYRELMQKTQILWDNAIMLSPTYYAQELAQEINDIFLRYEAEHPKDLKARLISNTTKNLLTYPEITFKAETAFTESEQNFLKELADFGKRAQRITISKKAAEDEFLKKYRELNADAVKNNLMRTCNLLITSERKLTLAESKLNDAFDDYFRALLVQNGYKGKQEFLRSNNLDHLYRLQVGAWKWEEKLFILEALHAQEDVLEKFKEVMSLYNLSAEKKLEAVKKKQDTLQKYEARADSAAEHLIKCCDNLIARKKQKGELNNEFHHALINYMRYITKKNCIPVNKEYKHFSKYDLDYFITHYETMSELSDSSIQTIKQAISLSRKQEMFYRLSIDKEMRSIKEVAASVKSGKGLDALVFLSNYQCNAYNAEIWTSTPDIYAHLLCILNESIAILSGKTFGLSSIKALTTISANHNNLEAFLSSTCGIKDKSYTEAFYKVCRLAVTIKTEKEKKEKSFFTSEEIKESSKDGKTTSAITYNGKEYKTVTDFFKELSLKYNIPLLEEETMQSENFKKLLAQAASTLNIPVMELSKILKKISDTENIPKESALYCVCAVKITNPTNTILDDFLREPLECYVNPGHPLFRHFDDDTLAEYLLPTYFKKENPIEKSMVRTEPLSVSPVSPVPQRSVSQALSDEEILNALRSRGSDFERVEELNEVVEAINEIKAQKERLKALEEKLQKR